MHFIRKVLCTLFSPLYNSLSQYLSLETEPRAARTRAALQIVMDEFARFKGDVGSSEVQVAVLTTKIATLAEHLAQHRKDHNSRRGLRAMLAKRRSLLQYLRRTSFDSYVALITKLGLKDTYGPQDRFTVRYKAAVPSGRGAAADAVVAEAGGD